MLGHQFVGTNASCRIRTYIHKINLFGPMCLGDQGGSQGVPRAEFQGHKWSWYLLGEGCVEVQAKNFEGIGGVVHFSMAEQVQGAQESVLEGYAPQDEFERYFDSPHCATILAKQLCCKLYLSV